MFVLCDVSRSITVEMSERWPVMGTHISGLDISGLEGKAERQGRAELVDRIEDSPLLYMCFPAQALRSCWKTYFLYNFVWLNSHL